MQMTRTKDRYRRGIVPMARSASNTAFTLVELLIVVSVIALLVAMLMPSLGNVYEAQYDAVCRSNLRQLLPVLLQNIDETSVITKSLDGEMLDTLRCPKGYFEDGGSQALNVTGSITEVRPIPTSVVPNQGPESNTQIFGFMEQEGYILPRALPVDITKPGRYGRSQGSYGSSSGTIPAGTAVDCFYPAVEA